MKTASNMYTIEHVLSEGESENIPTPTFQNQMMIEEIETCKDSLSKKQCKKKTKKNVCEKEEVKKKCKKSCNLCDDKGIFYLKKFVLKETFKKISKNVHISFILNLVFPSYFTAKFW